MAKTIPRKMDIDGDDADQRIKKAVGALVKRARNRAGYTARYVAEKIGVSRSSLAQIENGWQHVSAAVLWKLACRLGCDVSDFFPPTAKGHELSKAGMGLLAAKDPSAPEWAQEVADQAFKAKK